MIYRLKNGALVCGYFNPIIGNLSMHMKDNINNVRILLNSFIYCLKIL